MKKLLSLILLISFVFLVACQPIVSETTEDIGDTEDITMEESASNEEAEIAGELADFEDLESLDDDLSSDFEELENLDFE